MIFSPPPCFVFAPMATVSHAGFRHLVGDWGGCSYYFTEMIDASSHLRAGRYESFYADAGPHPEKVVFQIVGADEDALVRAAESLAAHDVAGIDINMGCSAPHIFRQGAGVAWMSDPLRAARLAARLRRVVRGKSLSMKLRLGETEDPNPLVALARALEGEGADFLTLHPRVRGDSLSRPSRWEWVSVLKNELSIPVVGNGDLTSLEVLRKRAANTPADAYMVGRRAVTAPWSLAYWRGRWDHPEFDFEVDLEAVTLRFHELLERHQPRDFWVTRSRRFYAYFSKNLAFGHRWGAQLQGHRDYQTLVAQVRTYWTDHPEEKRRLASDLET